MYYVALWINNLDMGEQDTTSTHLEPRKYANPHLSPGSRSGRSRDYEARLAFSTPRNLCPRDINFLEREREYIPGCRNGVHIVRIDDLLEKERKQAAK